MTVYGRVSFKSTCLLNKFDILVKNSLVQFNTGRIVGRHNTMYPQFEMNSHSLSILLRKEHIMPDLLKYLPHVFLVEGFRRFTVE